MTDRKCNGPVFELNPNTRYKMRTKLMTTHHHPGRKPRMLAQPAIINGKRSLAYIKGGELESYIPWDEAQEQMFQGNLPELTAAF